MTRLIDDIARMEEYALSSDGRGVLALLDGDPGASTTVELDAPGGIVGDDFGNRFVCSNRSPCVHVVLEDRYLLRAPDCAAGRSVCCWGASPRSSRPDSLENI